MIGVKTSQEATVSVVSHLEETTREERVLQSSELHVVLLGTQVLVSHEGGGGVAQLLRGVARRDHGLEAVSHGADQVGGEGVTEGVRHQDLGGRGETWSGSHTSTWSSHQQNKNKVLKWNVLTSPGGDDDIHCHVRNYGPVGIQQQPCRGEECDC